MELKNRFSGVDVIDLNNYFATALGMTKTSLSLSLIRKSVYFGATCVLPLFFAARTAFYAEPLADGLAAALSCTVFFFVYRKYLRGEGRLKEIKM